MKKNLVRNCLEPSSTELFSFGEESKEVWNHRACSSIGCDLDALTEEHRLKRGFRLSGGIDRFWKTHLPDIPLKFMYQPLAIILV